MRRNAILCTALATVAAAMALSPAFVESRAAPRPAVDRCADNGGRTLVASRWIRVYIKRDRLGNQYVRYCWVRTGATTTIRSAARRVTQLLPHYRIAGRYIAYTAVNFDADQPVDPGVILPVAVKDARRNRYVTRLFAQPPGASPDLSYADSKPGVTDLEMTRRGAVAWIASRPPDDDAYFYVQKADGTGNGQVVLDEGPDIDPRSLAISDQRIYWTSGSEVRSATLSGTPRERTAPSSREG